MPKGKKAKLCNEYHKNLIQSKGDHAFPVDREKLEEDSLRDKPNNRELKHSRNLNGSQITKEKFAEVIKQKQTKCEAGTESNDPKEKNAHNALLETQNAKDEKQLDTKMLNKEDNLKNLGLPKLNNNENIVSVIG